MSGDTDEAAVRSFLVRLARWDMLSLKPDGTGASTSDAPYWQREIQLIFPVLDRVRARLRDNAHFEDLYADERSRREAAERTLALSDEDHDLIVEQLQARLRDTEQGDGKQSRETPASAGDAGAAAWLAHVREILERIKAQQPATLAVIESNGFVFTDLGREPGNWMHLAFSIYTDLCEVDTLAEHALEALDEAVESARRTTRTAEPSVQELEARVEHLTTAIKHVICDSPGTPDSVKGYLREALRVAAG